METKKNMRVNINSSRKSFFSMGLIIAMALCLAAFEYTTFDKKTLSQYSSTEPIVDIDIITEIPEPPKPQNQNLQRAEQQSSCQFTVTNPQNIVTRDDNHAIDENQIGVNPDNNGETVILGGGNNNTVIDDDEPIDIASEMPTCKECIKIADEEKRAMCTYTCLNKQIMSDIKYPKNPLSDGVSGTVYVNFVVEKDGTISNVQVIRSVHPELDAEAVRVVKKLKPFEPGKNLGKPQRVRLIQPVKFAIAKS